MILPDIFFDIPRNPIMAVGLPIGLGFASALTNSPRKGKTEAWYKSLASPPLTPPNYVFPFAWTAIYASIGWASHLAVKAFDGAITPSATATSHSALKYYYANILLLNTWMPLFFGIKQQTLALGNLTALLGVAGKFAYDLYGLETKRGDGVQAWWFTVPYLGWLGYATYLNAGYVFLNWDQPGAGKRIP